MNDIQDIEVKISLYKSCIDKKKKRLIHINIIQDCLPIVKKIANSVALPSGVPLEDLVQVGSIGLIKAIEFFDASKNVKFRTYAIHFVKGEIKHYLRDKGNMIKAPRELQELVFKIMTAIKNLSAQGYEEPTFEQISEMTSIGKNKIKEVMDLELCKSILSLDQSVSNSDEDLVLMDKIPSGDYQEFLSSRENIIMLKDALDKLNPELKEIIVMNYFEDMNQREISDKLGISQMQVSRKIKKALNKLYEIINKKEDK